MDNRDFFDSKAAVPKRFRRLWPAADEIALLEAVVARREENRDSKPSPIDLAAALRGRLLSDDRRSAKQIQKRLQRLRERYHSTARSLSRGIVPEKDEDVRIYKLSKLLWEGVPRRTKKDPGRQEPRSFSKLAALYPCLAKMVEKVDAGCSAASGTLKRAFGRIRDDRAVELEEKVKHQLVEEAVSRARRDCLRAELASTILELTK
jgi:hypothetical protein